MGKRGIFHQRILFTAGVNRVFDAVILARPRQTVLVHRIAVWFAAGNANALMHVQRQEIEDAPFGGELVEEQIGLAHSVSSHEPILLTPDLPKIEVHIDEVFTTGTFTLNIDYEEVS